MEIRFHIVFMSPKVDYILGTSLFVCTAFAAIQALHTLPAKEVIGHIMELSGGGWFFFIAKEPVEGRDAYVTNQCYKSDFFLRGKFR